MERITQIIESKKVLFKNFTSLSLLQIANYVFPLITLPYLVRVLGPAKYGLVNFASAFVAYFGILTDYGFNLSATRDLSVCIKDEKKVSTIFSSVLMIKLAIYLISIFLFVAIINIFPQFQDHPLLYIISFAGVMGSTIFPIWLFQAYEKMYFILFINVAVRTIFTISIFIMISSENDFLLFALLSSIANLVVGLTGLIFAVSRLKVKLIFPGINEIKQQVSNGWNLFLSTLWINLYTTSNIFILGLFARPDIVGYFAAADKIRMAFQGILSPVTQSVFPYVNKLLSESYDKFVNFNKKLLRITSLTGLLISTFLFVFASTISDLILGHEYQRSILILKIIAWLPFIIIISNVLGIQTMIPLKKQKIFSTILFAAAVINILISLFLVPAYFEIGTSISLLITEIFVSSAFYIFVKKNNIKVI